MKKIYTLDEVHEILFDILCRFDAICTKYSLRYTLGGGTLLGAYRSRDFIPWDDDCDILMPRDDYDKFLSLKDDIFLENNGYDLISWHSNKLYVFPFAKFYRNDTYFIDTGYKPVTCGLYIDIFPIDGAPTDPKNRRKLYNKIHFLNSCSGITTWKITKGLSFFKRNLILLETFFPRIFYKSLRRFFPPRAEAVARKYSIDSTKFCGCLVWGYGWKKEIMPKEVFFPFDKKILFHGKLFSCLSQPEIYLKNIYGEDFMTPPPKEKQVCHELEAFYLEEGDIIK